MVDAIREWMLAQQRITEFMTEVSGTVAEDSVPACPAWTVRELLSHMIGLDADVLAGDEPDDHNSTWTQRQVDERQGRDVPALLQEWATLVEPLQRWMQDNGTRPLGDVLIHEQDLRGALGVSGAHDTPGLRILRDRFVGSFGEKVAALPPIAFDGGSFSWSSGVDGREAAVIVRAPEFDLVRALMSRRSATQLQAWTVRGDIGPYLSAFAALGSLPDAELHE